MSLSFNDPYRALEGKGENTPTLDHDLIDGAPAARFAKRLTQLIESGAGLHDYEREPAGVAAPR